VLVLQFQPFTVFYHDALLAKVPDISLLLHPVYTDYKSSDIRLNENLGVDVLFANAKGHIDGSVYHHFLAVCDFHGLCRMRADFPFEFFRQIVTRNCDVTASIEESMETVPAIFHVDAGSCFSRIGRTSFG